jgi:hypothetical protein
MEYTVAPIEQGERVEAANATIARCLADPEYALARSLSVESLEELSHRPWFIDFI